MENKYPSKEKIDMVLWKQTLKAQLLEQALKEIEDMRVDSQMDAFRMKNVATAALKENKNVWYFRV